MTDITGLFDNQNFITFKTYQINLFNPLNCSFSLVNTID